MLYHQLLRAELLGVPAAPMSPDRGGGGENGRGLASPMSSPAKKMFRYKSGDRCPLAHTSGHHSGSDAEPMTRSDYT